MPHDEEFIFESLIALIRELDRFPARADLIVKRNKNPKFPSPSSILVRFSEKKERVEKIFEYATQKEYSDVIEICKPIIENFEGENDKEDTVNGISIGEVYLFKSGRYYKIGKTGDTVRRGKRISSSITGKN